MGASVQLSSHSAAFEAPDHIGMTPRLSLRNITKRYPGITANDHVSLDIAPGEVLAILGENGAGKSTLMQVLDGKRRPSGGMVRLGTGARPSIFAQQQNRPSRRGRYFF